VQPNPNQKINDTPVPIDTLLGHSVADAAALAEQRAEAELECVATVLPDTGTLVPVAVAEGIHAGCFTQPDVRLIWCAAEVSAGEPLVNTLKLARRALEADRYWSDTAAIGSGVVWCDENLAGLAERFFRSRTHVIYHARRLLTAAAREQEVLTLAARIRDLLSGWAEPAAAPAERRDAPTKADDAGPSVVMMPLVLPKGRRAG
jgi:hypothetical protein